MAYLTEAGLTNPTWSCPWYFILQYSLSKNVRTCCHKGSLLLLLIAKSFISWKVRAYSVECPCQDTDFYRHPWQNPPYSYRWGGPAFPAAAPFHCRSCHKYKKQFLLVKSFNLAYSHYTHKKKKMTAITVKTDTRPIQEVLSNMMLNYKQLLWIKKYCIKRESYKPYLRLFRFILSPY